jgi:hypothetical protein
VGLAHRQGQGPQVVAAERQNVEGVELYLVIVLARMQRVEIGDAVDGKDDGLAIDDELLVSVLQRRLDDPRIALSPIVSAARDQTHAIAVALDPQAVAVIFDLVEPIRAVGDFCTSGRNAKLKRLKHAPQMGACL